MSPITISDIGKDMTGKKLTSHTAQLSVVMARIFGFPFSAPTSKKCEWN
jgi:hypothetical protein